MTISDRFHSECTRYRCEWLMVKSRISGIVIKWIFVFVSLCESCENIDTSQNICTHPWHFMCNVLNVVSTMTTEIDQKYVCNYYTIFINNIIKDETKTVFITCLQVIL